MLKFFSMGVHSESRDLLIFFFWGGEISANISDTVQNRYIVTVED